MTAEVLAAIECQARADIEACEQSPYLNPTSDDDWTRDISTGVASDLRNAELVIRLVGEIQRLQKTQADLVAALSPLCACGIGMWKYDIILPENDIVVARELLAELTRTK